MSKVQFPCLIVRLASVMPEASEKRAGQKIGNETVSSIGAVLGLFRCVESSPRQAVTLHPVCRG